MPVGVGMDGVPVTVAVSYTWAPNASPPGGGGEFVAASSIAVLIVGVAFGAFPKSKLSVASIPWPWEPVVFVTGGFASARKSAVSFLPAASFTYEFAWLMMALIVVWPEFPIGARAPKLLG